MGPLLCSHQKSTKKQTIQNKQQGKGTDDHILPLGIFLSEGTLFCSVLFFSLHFSLSIFFFFLLAFFLFPCRPIICLSSFPRHFPKHSVCLGPTIRFLIHSPVGLRFSSPKLPKLPPSCHPSNMVFLSFPVHAAENDDDTDSNQKRVLILPCVFVPFRSRSFIFFLF